MKRTNRWWNGVTWVEPGVDPTEGFAVVDVLRGIIIVKPIELVEPRMIDGRGPLGPDNGPGRGPLTPAQKDRLGA